MNIDYILTALKRHRVAYLLIGGMNFLLRHKPILTYDLDIWIDDTKSNRERCERALVELNAEWGPSEPGGGPVSRKSPGWLDRQAVFCLASPYGAIDVFRKVKGLNDWRAAYRASIGITTSSGIQCRGLSDKDSSIVNWH